MYRRDQAAIAAYVAVGADGWEDRGATVYLSVTYTIRNQTPNVTGMLERKADWAGDGFAIRSEARRVIAAGQHVAVLQAAHELVVAGDIPAALEMLARLPSLGAAKAGFLLQLIWGLGGCIDSRNIKSLNVKEIKLPKKAKLINRLAICAAYLDCCSRLGGSEFLWNHWCDGAAVSYPSMGTSDDISAEHVRWVATCHASLWLQP